MQSMPKELIGEFILWAEVNKKLEEGKVKLGPERLA